MLDDSSSIQLADNSDCGTLSESHSDRSTSNCSLVVTRVIDFKGVSRRLPFDRTSGKIAMRFDRTFGRVAAARLRTKSHLISWRSTSSPSLEHFGTCFGRVGPLSRPIGVCESFTRQIRPFCPVGGYYRFAVGDIRRH
ncbi:hypothetical protein [Limnoglobus roseus]|nr:hypothetical protein [Limnoglobus roseus]